MPIVGFFNSGPVFVRLGISAIPSRLLNVALRFGFENYGGSLVSGITNLAAPCPASTTPAVSASRWRWSRARQHRSQLSGLFLSARCHNRRRSWLAPQHGKRVSCKDVAVPAEESVAHGNHGQGKTCSQNADKSRR
ncbi:hypothetical protein BZL30_6014 [Mycobacterium kansasii]|uniref:Uncharacterized protein n=1 Tax=Mycobacterium kansasii TaxID=1768 RepID=A0A1V3WU22_MYCKA|nr:hypothetical protein BZL30_6014 [Mycobacterium kansasii]